MSASFDIDLSLSDLIRQIKLVVFDFDGVFTDNTVFVFDDGREAVRCTRSDGIGLKRLKELPVEIFVLSTEQNPVVAKRCEKLGLRCFSNCPDKLAVLTSETKKLGLAISQVAFVGNDVNDLECLQAVGLPILVQDAHPDVIPLGRYRTLALGGRGAVREVCDLFVRSYAARLSPKESGTATKARKDDLD